MPLSIAPVEITMSGKMAGVRDGVTGVQLLLACVPLVAVLAMAGWAWHSGGPIRAVPYLLAALILGLLISLGVLASALEPQVQSVAPIHLTVLDAR